MEEHPWKLNPQRPAKDERSPLREDQINPTGPTEPSSSPFTEQYMVGASPLPPHVLAAYQAEARSTGEHYDSEPPIVPEVVGPGRSYPRPAYRPRERAILLPLTLFVATCFTTYAANGPIYAVAVMTILTAHEFGHFFQTLRYKIHASFPMFIPIPLKPLGTMGAVIGMAPHEGDRKALFDVAVSGPIAGLVPTLICCVWGLQLSEYAPVQIVANPESQLFFGAPLLFQWMSEWIMGPIGENQMLLLHPIAFAGWVGLLVTALNLFPVGQLDGGHTLYALLGKKAHVVARFIWIGCFVYVVMTRNWGWLLMLGLVWMMGTSHPPTADDSVPLGLGRKILGWALLLFLPIGFTPTPFVFPEMEPQQQQQPKEEIKVVQSAAENADLQQESHAQKMLLPATDNHMSNHEAYQQQRHTADQNQELHRHRITHLKKENRKRGRHSLPIDQHTGWN